MIIKHEELYETLKEYCPGKYSVGLHGINLSRVRDFYGLDITNRDEVSEAIASKIVREGLRVESGRTINGTVAFYGRLDDRNSLKRTFDGLTYYYYSGADDYIIVATPVELVSENGDTLYAGATNLDSKYKSFFDTTGCQTSTILDQVILANGQKIDPKYILGRFKTLEDGNIELQLNPQHISKTGGKVSQKEFNDYVHRLHCDLFFDYPGLIQTILKKDYQGLKEFVQDTYCDSKISAYLLETIGQLIEEDYIEDLRPEDIETLKELKELYKQRQEQKKRDDEAKKQKLAAMANPSFEDIQEFALTHHPAYFQEYPYTVRNNVELMRRLTKTPNLNSFIVYYLGEDVKNDSETMINLVNNCSTNNFSDYFRDEWQYKPPKPNQSDLGYEVIGLDVRSNPLFWESLNARVLEINKEEGTNYPYFDTEKEIRLATEEKSRKTQK
ncbi:MAG: hypothetical protein IJE53_03615 [Bacilli bacterium]|nr:hypothetical protein [Bacilli bacterium]